MARTKKYPELNKVGWRFARTFVATFLVLFGTGLANVGYNDVQALQALLLSAMTASLAALGKTLREYIASGDYESLLHRLPV